MKKQNYCLTLLVFLAAWSGATTTQAAIADAVVAWGYAHASQSYETYMPATTQNGMTAIAVGGNHTVALKIDGAVVAWGLNDSGQTTVPVAARSGVRAIAAGTAHTVALKSDGSVLAWGLNDTGQAIVPDGARSGVTAIAAGDFHTVALKTNGSVVAWGYNHDGQTTVPVAARSGVTAIAAGYAHTVALKTDGSVVAWGAQQGQGYNYGQTTVPAAAQNGVTAIAAGSLHTVALKSDGSVIAWGDNSEGQTTVPVAARTGVRAIAAGDSHTVAWKTDGTVVAWGASAHGGMTTPAGLGGVTAIGARSERAAALVISTAPNITMQPASQTVTVNQRLTFTVTVTGFPLNFQWRRDGVDVTGATNATYSVPFAQASQAGGYTVVVSNPAGSVTSAPPAALTVSPVQAIPVAPVAVLGWGDNEFGQTTTPAAAQSGVRAIAAGFHHTVALKSDGSVVAWGDNGSGQSTVPIEAQDGVTAIAAGYLHTVALKSDGSVVAWGKTYDGTNYVLATVPAGLSGVIAIAAGHDDTLALKDDGPVVAWGLDNGGETHVPVAAQSGVTAIAAGWFHSVALKADGTVVVWGEQGFFGESSIVPPGLSGVTAIAAGAYHTVLLFGAIAPEITTQPEDQTVNAGQHASFSVTARGYPLTFNYQWRKDGINISGAIGATFNAGPAQASQAGEYTVVVSNSAGSVTNAPPVTLRVNPSTPGSVVAWGANFEGQTTVPLAARSDVTAIAAGWGHTVALKTDGTVVAWGDNRSGQVTGHATSPANPARANPVVLGGQVLSGVIAIAAGSMQTVALKADGSVAAWGDAETTLPGEWPSGVTAIAAGNEHTVVLRTDGSVLAWGRNGFYDAGQATVPVAAQSGVTAIAAGDYYSVVLKSDGSVVAWGAGTDNTGVQPDFGQSRAPLAVQSGVTAIAAGDYHTVALLRTAVSLQARRSGTGLVLSWPATATGFTLQATFNLTLPVTWIDLTNPPAVAGAQFTVTNSSSGSPQFYRLRKP